MLLLFFSLPIDFCRQTRIVLVVVEKIRLENKSTNQNKLALPKLIANLIFWVDTIRQNSESSLMVSSILLLFY